MRLLRVVRHGVTASNMERRLMGRLDESLSEEGVKQSEALAAGWTEAVDVIFSSPLARAHETATILNAKLDVPLVIREELAERDSGSLSGQLWNVIPKLTNGVLSIERLQANYEIDYSPWGGESKEAVKVRVQGILSFMKSTKEYSHPVAVTHAGILRIMYLLFGRSLESGIANASVHEFDLDTLPTLP